MMMQRIIGIISNANFGLAILAATRLVFDSFVGVPEYLKIAGRMHPLMLHLPIGMFVMFLILFVLRKSFEAPDFEKLLNFVLLLTGFFALITAISGSLLSHEPDAYNVNELAFHRNTGFGFAFGVYLLSIVNGKYPTFSNVLLGINTLLLIVAGHKGDEITHGKDFLFPNKDVKEILSDTNTTLFTAMVHPIWEKNCYSCHNEEKTKGGLLMTDCLSLLKGGQSGRVLLPGNADSSLMVQSMLLPLEDEKHMPPNGKPQLTAQEKEIIIAWINSGASFSKKVSAYKPDESIRKLYDANTESKKQKQYSFSSVDNKTLAALNSHFMTVKPLFGGSPALKASLFLASEYVLEHLKQLLQVKQQLIHLHLADLPVTDRDIEIISQFISLEKLVLNGNKNTEQGILKLKQLSKLEELSLANTSTSEAIEPLFSQLPSLSQIFITVTGTPYTNPSRLMRMPCQF